MATAFPPIADGTTVPYGTATLEFGKTISELQDSNAWLAQPEVLRQRLKEHGYLLLRGLQDRELVLEARRDILRWLQSRDMLAPGSDLEDGLVGPQNRGALVPQDAIKSFRHMMGVVNSPQIMGFFERLLGGPARTFDYKWLRTVPKGGYTGFHYDIVYMGRGTHNLYTCWTPYGDVSLEMGPLLLALDTPKAKKLRETYGAMDVDRDKVRGWFSGDPHEIMEKFGGRLATTQFMAGDVLIFEMFLMHGSVSNQTGKYRLSSDTRYQLASEPVDERWVGENPPAHYAWHQGEGVDMAAARAKWGV